MKQIILDQFYNVFYQNFNVYKPQIKTGLSASHSTSKISGFLKTILADFQHSTSRDSHFSKPEVFKGKNCDIKCVGYII